MTIGEHIPAWKRIGLKLKNAKDATDDTVAPSPQPSVLGVDPHSRNVSHKKRQRTDDDEEQPSSAKKPRAAKTYTDSALPDQSLQSGNDRFISSIYKGRTLHGIAKTPQKIVFDDTGSSQATPADGKASGQLTSLSRKKSVTFTPETKIEDGESGQTFSKAWLTGQSTISSSTESADIAQPTDTPSKASARTTSSDEPNISTNDLVKRKKKAKNKLGQQSTTQAEPKSACITYLQQFHTDREHWKFNKARQNDLFRHIWDLTVLPAPLDDAITEYVKGLQGTEPRKRLVEGATAILEALLEKHKSNLSDYGIDTSAARKAAYEQAMQVHDTKAAVDDAVAAEDDASTTHKLEGQQAARAHALLWQALGQEVASRQPVLQTASRSVASNGDNATSKRKARKSRTAVSDSSDSSSSESDGDSDSSSDASSDE